LKTIVIGDPSTAVDGIITLRGGNLSHQDTVYILEQPLLPLGESAPVWTVSVHVYDGYGDAIVELSKGNDVLRLGAGSDWAKAGCGDDLVVSGAGEDLIMAGCGQDRVYGGSGADVLAGGYGDDVIHGGADHDVLYGGKGNDFLRGGTGDDALFGQQGDDVLVGGLGADVMIGGMGADEFRVSATDGDRVMDFDYDAGDVLIVDGVDLSPDWEIWIGPGGVVAAPPVATEAVVMAPDGGFGG
jgi:Ca2+-binding RTX toxin-like protein